MNTSYNDYMKNTYENLVNIANNWIIDDCEMGVPLLTFNGQVVGAGQKKSKKKSEIQVHVCILFKNWIQDCLLSHLKNSIALALSAFQFHSTRYMQSKWLTSQSLFFAAATKPLFSREQLRTP